MGRAPEKRGGGESHRTARVEKEVRDVVGLYLVSGFRGSVPGLVSLTRVSVSADLKIANFNFTMIMTQEEGEEPSAFEKREAQARKDAVKELNTYAKDFQGELARKLKMRFTPRVSFFYDEGFESAMKVERLLREMSLAAGRADEGVARRKSNSGAPDSDGES